jgi:riboflavin biosynthesis pyrimidine reductase
MICSINGKIISEHWGNWQAKFGNVYETCHQSFKSQAWMCGRVTLERDFSDEKRPGLEKSKEPVDKKAYVGNKDAKSFAIAVDAGGKLGWKHNEINGDHIIEVLTEQVDDTYLHYLQRRNISYIFAGESKINFAKALLQLGSLFPIKTIMLEGGGLINGSMLTAGLIGEVSLLFLPLVDATANTATVFDQPEKNGGKKFSKYLKLKEVRKLKHQVLWITYGMAARK